MQLKDKLHLVIYRVRERGLEVFVRDADANTLELPAHASSPVSEEQLLRTHGGIELEEGVDLEVHNRGLAIEGDYHDIPSLKGLLLDDARRLKRSLTDSPTLDGGRFVGLRVLAKRLLPEQYRMVKELRDIIVDRNSTTYL